MACFLSLYNGSRAVLCIYFLLKISSGLASNPETQSSKFSIGAYQIYNEKVEEGKLHWCLEFYEKNLHFFLRKSQNGAKLSSTTSYLHSRGLQPFLLSSTGKRLELLDDKLLFNFSSYSWVINDENVLTFLIDLDNFIIANDEIEKIDPSEWFLVKIKKSITPAVKLHEPNLEIDKGIRNMHFFHPCRPYISLFISDSSMFLTYNNFQTWTKVKVVSNALEIGTLSDCVLTYHGVLFLINEQVYHSQFAAETLELLQVNSDNKIEGISQTKVCYRSHLPKLPKENHLLLLWSRNAVYSSWIAEEGITDGRIGTYEIKEVHMNTGYQMINFVQHENHPLKFLITGIDADTHSGNISVIPCEIKIPTEAKCIEKQYFLNAHFGGGISSFYAGNCAELCGFVVNSKGLHYLYPSYLVDKLLSRESPKSIAYSSDMTLWIFVLETLWLVVSSDGKFIQEFEATQNLNSFIPKLLSLTKMSLVKCTGTYPCLSIIVGEMSLIHDILQERNVVTIQPHFNQPELKHTNVLTISDLSHKLEIDGFISDNMNLHHSLVMQYELGGSKLRFNTKTRHETMLSTVSSSSLFFDINASINCMKSTILKCGKGIAKFNINFLSQTENLKVFSPANMFYVNVTCPSNIHLFLGPKTTGGGCMNKDNCTMTIKENDLVHLSFELHEDHHKISDVWDDIVITEENGRSGFFINNQYVLGKECFLCDQFYNITKPSQLVLQTIQSACPCKQDMFSHGTWTGNISFLGAVSYTNNEDNFIFTAQVLDHSLCNHRTSFKVKIINAPPPTFQLWEYLVIVVFFGVTILSLTVSYRNYIIFMKENKDKMSTMTLKSKGE